MHNFLWFSCPTLAALSSFLPHSVSLSLSLFLVTTVLRTLKELKTKNSCMTTIEMKRKHFNYRQQKPIEMVNLSLFLPAPVFRCRHIVVLCCNLCRDHLWLFNFHIWLLCTLWIINGCVHYGRQSNYVSCVFRTMQKSPFRIFFSVAIAYFRIVQDPEDRYADNKEITCLK